MTDLTAVFSHIKCNVTGFISLNTNNQLQHLVWEAKETFTVLNHAHTQESSVTGVKVINFQLNVATHAFKNVFIL